MRGSLLLMFCLLIFWRLPAQLRNYNFYNLSRDNGLPTNDFQSVYQDSFGFLWLASYEGLFRWDGYTFKTYHHNEKDSLSLGNNIVYSIFEDHQKRLWIGNIDGLNLYDRLNDSFIKCTIGQKGQKIPVNAIAEDSKHQLWLATSNGLCKYNYDTGISEWHIVPAHDNITFCLTIDHNDEIWTGTFNGGVHRFSQVTKQFTSFVHSSHDQGSISSNKIKSILADDENNIWIGTADKGISVINSEGHVIKHYAHLSGKDIKRQNTITCLYQDKNKRIWIGAGREPLYYIDKGSDQPAQVNNVHQNAQNPFLSISSICEDTFGNIWFSTAGNGLFFTNVNKNLFENYLQKQGVVEDLNTTVITTFHEDRHGNVWIGTDRGGFIKTDASKNSFTLFNNASHGLSSDAITDIKEDDQGKLWITTWNGGVMEFDPKTQKIKKFLHDPADLNSIPLNDAKILLPDDTLIWIGTHGEGLAAYDRKRNKFIHSKNNFSFPFAMDHPAWINHLYKDSKNRLWISTYSGLFVFDGKKLTHFEYNGDSTSISSNSINMVTEDPLGNIWVVSESGGLDQFRDATLDFIRLNEKYPLPETIKGIVVDDHNVLWMSSNEGIIAFDPLHATVTQYDASEGLQGNSFFQKAVLKRRNGQLCFGGPKGFNVFHPDSLRQTYIPSYFYTKDLFIYNKLQYPNRDQSPLSNVLAFTDELILTPEQSFFSIEVAAINLYAPSKTRYAYQLEGLSDQWINLENERKISFTNLDPGSYTLKLKYTGINGKWYDAPKPLAITILPPWWKTIWFKLALLMSISGSVVALFYIRVASIRNRNAFLKSEVKKRTHELSEANSFLVERNEEIKLQKERLEEFNHEVLRQSEKILDQQKHITEQNHALESTVEELQKLNKTKDHFFSILAHDLKNPISALTGISDFMKNNFLKLDKKEALNYLNSIHKSSNAIYDLLINLLNWSRTQSKNIEYTPVDFNIQELIQKNVTLLEQQFTNKHISVSVTTDPQHHAHADYNMIDTVVRNIVSNSIKFTEYNGTISVSTTAANDHVGIRISDSGVGMTKEQLQKLFSVDKNNISVGTAGERGTGLGLVITREFIQINKGLITVESQPGKGTDFYITLPKPGATTKPVLKVHRNASPARMHSSDFWDNVPVEEMIKIKGKKIVIIDDNTELRCYLKLLLSGTFEIFEAANGEEGLQLARNIQPTAVVTDLIMPVMNGLDFCREVKNNPSTSHIPVILLTSQWEETSQLSGYQAGADIFLTKPVKKELFLQVILNIIHSQEKLRQRIQENIFNNQTFDTEDVKLNKVDEEFLKRIIGFIEKHIADPNIDARSICEEIGMSRTVLYSKIKSLAGQSVHEFIKSIRLKKSILLLLEGRLNISQVATEVGFNSHSYFNKCFVKQYGVSPKEYLSKRNNLKFG